MERYDYAPNQLPRVSSVGAAEQVSAFLRVVYGWMCAGLGITATVAWVVAGSPGILITIAQNRPIFWALLIAQLGIVFVMSARVEKLSPMAAGALFVTYSALTGVTMAFVLLAYTGASVASTFVVTAGMFGSLALFGTFTSRSLAGWGQFLFMGLIGVVLASVVGHLLAERCAAVRDRVLRRNRLHRAHRLRRAAAPQHGARASRRSRRRLRHRRRAGALSRFRESLPDAAAPLRRPAELKDLRRPTG